MRANAVRRVSSTVAVRACSHAGLAYGLRGRASIGHPRYIRRMVQDLRTLRDLIAVTPPLPAVLAEAEQRLDDDPGHDVEHALRVALWTVRICDGAVEPRLAVAAALFHDLVNLPKNHPERAQASERSAALADELLAPLGYSPEERVLVCDAIRDHSYSRGAVPETLLGRALQDADRLEALGVLGLFRTISTGTRMSARYFDAHDPWAEARELDDLRFSVDHFPSKLFRLPATMCTEAGRREAVRRAERMHRMLLELGEELGHEYRPHASLNS